MTSQKLSALLLYAGTVHTVMQNTRPCKTRFITGIIITVVMNTWTISQPNPAFNLFTLQNYKHGHAAVQIVHPLQNNVFG